MPVGESEWFHGVIIAYNAHSKKHRIKYDDGDLKDHLLTDPDEKWELELETAVGVDATADLEVEAPGLDMTKPPPNWTKITDFGKFKGYRGPNGQKSPTLREVRQCVCARACGACGARVRVCVCARVR